MGWMADDTEKVQPKGVAITDIETEATRHATKLIPTFSQGDHVRIMQTDSVLPELQNRKGLVTEPYTDSDGHLWCRVMVQGMSQFDLPNACLMGDSI